MRSRKQAIDELMATLAAAMRYRDASPIFARGPERELVDTVVFNMLESFQFCDWPDDDVRTFIRTLAMLAPPADLDAILEVARDERETIDTWQRELADMADATAEVH